MAAVRRAAPPTNKWSHAPGLSTRLKSGRHKSRSQLGMVVRLAGLRLLTSSRSCCWSSSEEEGFGEAPNSLQEVLWIAHRIARKMGRTLSSQGPTQNARDSASTGRHPSNQPSPGRTSTDAQNVLPGPHRLCDPCLSPGGCSLKVRDQQPNSLNLVPVRPPGL